MGWGTHVSHRPRQRTKAASAGFTITELMIGIGISGILASLALPTFLGVKDKAKYAEAYTHLGAMFTGVKAYYSAEHWTQGVITAGGSTGTNCSIAGAFTSNTPSDRKTVLDWGNEHCLFTQINFTPPEPLLFSYGATVKNGIGYFVSPDCLGAPIAGSAGGWNGGSSCGNPPSNGSGLYTLNAKANPDNDAFMTTITWNLCTDEGNNMFVCGRKTVPEETGGGCALRPSKRSSAPGGYGALLLLGLWLFARRLSRIT